jgi:hypothetical protein
MAKKSRPAGEAEFRTLVERSMEELRLKTQAHVDGWGLGSADRWDMDQTDGQLIFTTKKLTATAPAQIIGTYSTQTGSWMWGWEHPSVEPHLQEHAKRVREYGEKHGIAALTTRKLECTEDEAWEFTALACHLSGAQGAYRGPAGPALVFMTFGKVSLTKPKGNRGSS